MFSRQWLLCLLLVTVFVSSMASGKDIVSDNLQDCQPQRGRLLANLGTTFRRCIKVTSQTFQQFSSNLQLSECLNHTQAFCTSLPSIRECLDEEANRWSRCHNETSNKVFDLFLDTLNVTLNDLCQDDGETLSTLLYSFNGHTLDYRARNDFVRECIIGPSTRLEMVDRSEGGVTSKYWYIHQEVKRFRDCLRENIHGDEEFVRNAVQHINITLNRMKCLHPEDESVVLCKDVPSGVIDRAELCPLKTISELMVPLSLMLESRATNCFVLYDTYGPALSDAQSLQDFQEYFSRYCRRQERVKHCISQISQAAQVCLNEESDAIFNLVRGYLELVLEGGCSEQGRRLATIMHTASVIRETTNQKEPLLKCLKEAQEKRNKTMDDPARVYDYYQELPVVNECLLQNVGDTVGEDFRNDVTALIRILEENMKCFHPEDKSVVLCKTIHNN